MGIAAGTFPCRPRGAGTFFRNGVTLAKLAPVTVGTYPKAKGATGSNKEQEPSEVSMTVARVSKITAGSTKSFQAAVEEGAKRATKSLRGVTGLHVVEQKAKIEKGKIVEYRVSMEVTFVLED